MPEPDGQRSRREFLKFGARAAAAAGLAAVSAVLIGRALRAGTGWACAAGACGDCPALADCRRPEARAAQGATCLPDRQVGHK